MKVCSRCKADKQPDEFHKQRSGIDGLQSRCKVCTKVCGALRQAEYPEKQKARCAAYCAANKEKVRVMRAAYRAANHEKLRGNAIRKYAESPEKPREASANWRVANPARRAAQEAGRNARKIQATPLWANLARMGCYYAVAAMLNREGLQKWHVDHIVPLRGKNVCGLHVENNLQLLTAADNISKGNKFSPA